MKYHYEPFHFDSNPNCVILDGYTEKEDLEGPFRWNGLVVYFDHFIGKLFNPKTHSFINTRDTDANIQF